MAAEGADGEPEEECDFETALLQLQSIHQTKVQTLQEKLDHQLSVNASQEKDLRELRDTVKRLQRVVSEAKQKIKYQAAVISEQCIQLYGNRHALAGKLDQSHSTSSSASNGVSNVNASHSSAASNRAPPTSHLTSNRQIDHTSNRPPVSDIPSNHTSDLTSSRPPNHTSDLTSSGPPNHTSDLTSSRPPNHTSDPTSNRPPDHTCVTLFDSPSMDAHSSTNESASLNDETVLPGPGTLRSFSMETVGVEGMEEELLDAESQTKETSPDCSSPPPPPQADSNKHVVGLQHVTYSHASSNAEQAPEASKSPLPTKPSLSRRKRKVLYKTLNKPTSLPIPVRNSRSPESDSPTSPSLLTSQSSSLRTNSSADSVTMETVSKESEGSGVEDEDGESRTSEQEEAPMSCSMFATAPGYSMLAPTHMHGDGEAADGDRVDSPIKHSADHTDINCLPQTPRTPVKVTTAASIPADPRTDQLISPSSDAVSVIPITPGIKSVESIKTFTAPKPPPVVYSSALPHLESHNGAEQTNGVESSGELVPKKDVDEEDKKILVKERPSHPNGVGRKVSKTKKMAAAAAGSDAVKHHYKRRGYRLEGVAGTSRKRSRKDGIPASSSKGAVERREEVEEEDVILVGMETRKQGRPGNEEYSINRDALRVAERAGLPTTYKFDAKILKAADRDKLDAKPCPDCKKWYESGGGGVHGNQRAHLRHTCRHKALHLPPDSDDKMWDISWNDTDD